MDPKEEISFKYPNKIGHVMIWLGLPILGMMILLLISATFYWLYSLRIYNEGFYIDLFKGLALLGVSLWMSASFIHWVKDYHACITSYTLSDTGVSIEMASGLKQELTWSDFDSAFDNRTLRYIKIFSKKIDKPVTIIFGTPGKPSNSATANYKQAQILVSSKMRVVKKYW